MLSHGNNHNIQELHSHSHATPELFSPTHHNGAATTVNSSNTIIDTIVEGGYVFIIA